MWSKTFLEADEWKKVRDSLPKLIYDSWDSLSERLKRSSVTRCAQQLMESESTTEKAVDPFLRQIKTGEAFKPIKTIDDISTDLPMPNPLSAHLIPVEKADPGIPGEIVIDENGKLLKRYLRYTNFTKFLKDSYDEWLLNGLIPLIENQVIDVRGGRIRFAHVSLTPPRDGGQKLFPRMAREKGLTYGLDIHARVILEKDLGDGRVEEVTLGDNVSKTKKTLGRIPLMLGSKKCYLYGLSPSQLRAVQEDPSDPLGYFVVSGTEKVVLMHEKLRLNRIFVTSKKRGKDKEPEASITIETPRGTVRVNLVLGKSKRINFATRFKVEIKPSSEKGKERTEEEEQHDRRRAIRAAAAAKKDGNYRYIGVEKLFYILRLLENPGISDEGDGADFERWPEFMTEKIVQFTKAEWRNKVEAEIGILRFKYPNEKPAFVKQEIARIKGGVNIHDAKDVDEVVRNLVMHEIFPQLNDLGDIENIFTLKSNMLALMVARLIEVNLGLEDYDDRDSWSNKRLESASRAMDQLMRAIWRRMVTNMKKELTNKNSIDSTAAIERQLSKIGITTIFNASFVGTNWGVQGSMKTNMTQIPNRESVVSLFSHMHRVEVATNRNDKQPSIRMIHGTQWGYICPAESPEGANCGIVKNLTVTAQVTYGKTDGNVLYEILNARLEEDRDTMLFSKIPSSRHTFPVLVNGKFLGWCMGVELRRYMIQARRSQRIPIDAGITVDVRNALLIHTDTSRLVRPLLVVEPVTKDDGKVVLEPLIVTKGLMGAPIKTLFEEKVIEYVDSFEVESSGMVVATTFDSIKDPRRTEKMLVTSLSDFKKNKKNVQRRLKRKPKHEKLLKELAKWKVNIDSTESVLNKIRNTTPFSHVEMDPQSILGISASIIPYPNHNQGPRNTYQASMGKQALGINRAHTMACFSGKHKVLAYPNRPLFEPQLNQLLNLNAYPQGEMVWMMFGTFTGNTQEDAIVVNQASIDMGKFRLFKYNNIRVVFKSESNKVEELRRPSDLSEEELKNAYKHMNVNGLPTIGAHIEERQAVVGKVVMEGKEEIANDSLRLGYGEEGIVNQVIVTDNGAETIVKVQLRMLRIPIAGDKYSPRNAQKGTIGKIVPSWQMPYTEDGIIPDIIVNPHAMPSRMTMSFPMEMIASKAGAIKGERINATAFREFEAERFKSILRDYGYADDGKHVMYNGITGRALTARMYSGPVYYQALRHHVLDKIQVRRTGPYSATSRQPVKGRAKKGGLRFGEMERDAAIAHGASFFLQERLCGVSDRCIDTYCIKCGQIATALDQGYSCNLCEDEAVFAKAETTAALRLLNMLAGGFGIKQVPKF